MSFDYNTIREKVTDGFGRKYVVALFEEFKRSDCAFAPMWSLHKEWKPKFLSKYDPTEYECAMELIGDWEHYQIIRNHKKVKPIMDRWVVEAEVAMRSKAIKQMVKHSQSPNGSAAAKWIAEGSYMTKVLKNKSQEREVLEELADSVASDIERLGLKLISGGGR